MKSYLGVSGLADPSLLRTEAFIGEWVSSVGRERFNVLNPSSGEIICDLPRLTALDVSNAVAAAQTAFLSWSHTCVDERRTILLAWSSLLLKNAEDLARILTSEQGKPYREALSEIEYAATFIDWFANQALRSTGYILPSFDVNSRLSSYRQPIGVGAAITP